MQSKDLETLQSIHNALSSESVDSKVSASVILNPAEEVERSLVGFLKHRLNKLQENSSFEESIKETILCRLSEATFPQLINLMDIIQRNNNVATEKVLAPFITQNGNTSVTETLRQRGGSPEEDVYNGIDDKNILQSLNVLGDMLAKQHASDHEE